MPEAKPHGPWLIHESNTVYQDPWLRLQRDEVTRPDGQPGSYCVVHLKPGVSVIAIDDQDFVYLAEEFHYAVGRTTLEAVSGGIEAGESALSSAKRELVEEVGIAAKKWEQLGTVDPFTASLCSPTQLFVAKDLTLGEANPEGTEQIRRVRMPFAEAISGVLDGHITHAPTCVLLLLMERQLR